MGFYFKSRQNKHFTGVFITVFFLGLVSVRTAFAAQTFETPSKIPGEDFIAYVEETMEQGLKEQKFAGAAIAVTKGREVVFQKGYGYADLDAGKKVDPETTVFEYGSVTKLFTWISLMQLSEEGKIDLEKDVKEYLPDDFEVPRSYDQPIRVVDLMNHQGGFDDYFIGLFYRNPELPSLREAIEENKVLQVAEPGKMISYSNYGAALAGYLVECVSGHSFDQYVREHILRPCGMEHASLTPVFGNDPWIREHKSKGYMPDAKGIKEAPDSYVAMYPAGSGNGTVMELAKFGMALCRESQNPVLFPDVKGIEKLFSTSSTAKEGLSGISYGFFQFEGEKKTFWHNGETEHFSAFFACVPEEEFSISIVCNCTNGMDLIQELGFASVAKSGETLKQCQKELENDKTGFPSAKEVEGTYADYRQVHHGISQLYYLMPGTFSKIEAIGENRIRMQDETFTQVAPYLYLNEENGIHACFTVKNGKVEKISYLTEAAPVAASVKLVRGYSYAALGLSAVLTVVFLVYSLVFWIRRCMKKKKMQGGVCGVFFGNISLLISAGLIWNIVCIFQKILSCGNFSSIRGNVAGNRILMGLLFLSSIAALFFGKKQQGKAGRIITVLYAAAVCLFDVMLLINGACSMEG